MNGTLNTGMATTLAMISVCASLSAVAEETLPHIASIGVAQYMARDRASDITGPFTPPNLSVDVQDATTVAISYTQFFTQQIALSLIGGWPVRQGVRGAKSAENLDEIGSAKQIAPTLLVQYHWGENTTALRPFVGIGVNHSRFFSTKSSASLQTALGGDTAIKIGSSTGLAWEVGARYRLSDQYALSGRFLRANVKSRADITTGPITRSTDINFRPHVVAVTLDYIF
jgi:outer membrane protein